MRGLLDLWFIVVLLFGCYAACFVFGMFCVLLAAGFTGELSVLIVMVVIFCFDLG